MRLEKNYNHNCVELNHEKILKVKIWQHLRAYKFYNYNRYNQDQENKCNKCGREGHSVHDCNIPLPNIEPI
jgi:hypothetical protein